MVEANTAAVTGPTLGALHSLPTVSSLLTRCSSLPSSQATCLLTSLEVLTLPGMLAPLALISDARGRPT